MKKNIKKGLIGLLAMSLGLGVIPVYGGSQGMAETEYAFNQESGKLDVAYEKFLGKHDVVYKAQPAQNIESMPVANGRVGAMVWGEDKIQMEIMNVDASPHGALSQARVSWQTFPKTTKKNFEQRLNLYDGNISIAYDEEVKATIFGVPGSELIGMNIKDNRENVKGIYFDIEVWAANNNIGHLVDIQDPEAWDICNVFEDKEAGIVGITKGISEIEPFGYTFATKVVGAQSEIKILDDNNIRVYIEPTASEYTIYMSTASAINAIEKDSVQQAKNELKEVARKEVQSVIYESEEWWHKYWDKSFISYDDGTSDGDYHENIYYLYQYLFGGAAYGKYPMHFINGVYRYDKDNNIHWSNGYWHFNQRAVYNGALASNRIDAAMSYYNFYEELMDEMQGYTKDRFQFENDALKTTETMRWDGYPFKKSDSGELYENDYVGWIYSTGPEVAANMYDLYRYTQDKEILERFYTYIEKTVEFIVQWARWDEETNQYHLDCSNSLENWWKINNSTPDNAAVRNILPKFLEAYSILGKTDNEELVNKATDVLNKLEPITQYEGLNRYAPYDVYDKSVGIRNCQNPELELIYPHSITGIGYPDYETAVNTYWNRQVGQGISIWTVDGIQAARLGLGDEAARVLKQMQVRNQRLVCGITDDGNGNFESMGLHVSTINEMYLQSYDDLIRVFPAVPSKAEFQGAFTLLATGGFLVSSEYANQEVKYIGLNSQYGGKAQVAIPWDVNTVWINGEEVAVREGKIDLETEVGKIYVIENPSKPLKEMIKGIYTGEINQGIKKLEHKTLGIKGQEWETNKTGKILEYDFEEMAQNQIIDKSDNKYHGSLSGNVSEAEGKDGKGVKFQAGKITVNHSKLQLNDDFEVSLDIKPEQIGNSIIMDKYGSDNTGFYVDMYNGQIRVLIGNRYNLSVTNTMRLNEWNKLKILYSTTLGKMQLWINEALVGSLAVSSAMPINDQPLYIGTGRWDHQPLYAVMDNLKIAYLEKEENILLANGESYQVKKGGELLVNSPGVLENDEGKKVLNGYAELVKDVEHGVLKLYGDGGFSYVPDREFVGIDSFKYQIIDDTGRVSNEAIVEIYVGVRATAVNDRVFGGSNEKIIGNVTGNDIGVDGLPLEGEYEVQLVCQPSNGGVEMDRKGNFVYTPQKDFVGSDEFSYQINTGGILSNQAKVKVDITRYAEGVIFEFKDEGEIIQDLLGGDNNGKAIGQYSYIETPYGRGMELNGGYIEIPYADNLKMEDQFEVEITFKPLSDQYFNRLLANYINETIGFLIDVGPYEGKQHIRIIAGDEIPGYSWQSNAEIKADEWTTMRFVVDSTQGKAQLYINGVLDSERNITKPLVGTGGAFCIGAHPNGANRMAVQVADFKIFNLPELSHVTVEVEENEVDKNKLEVKIGADQIDEKTYAQDYVFEYDPAIFEITNIKATEEKHNVIYKEEEKGKVRILVASIKGIVAGEQSVVIELRVKGNQSRAWMQTELAIKDVKFGRIVDETSVLLEGKGINKIVVVESIEGEVDTSVLAELIAEAKEVSEKAQIGTEPGQYPETAKNKLNEAIKEAEKIMEESSNQGVIDQAVSKLRDEIEKFKGTVIQGNNPDINQDGIVDVADLALVAYYYRATSTSPNWEMAKKSDLNHDGVIDIGDLGIVAGKILN